MNKVFTDEELKTTKLKDIIKVIETKMTEDEVEKLRTIEDAEERRAFVVGLYKKYEAEKETPPTPPTPPKDEEKKNDPENPNPDPDPNADGTVTPIVENEEIENLDMSFSVDIRGIYGYNGTMTFGCKKLLALAFRHNDEVRISFATPERAQQFVRIVENVKSVEGIFNLTDDVRAKVVARIKEVNMID